MVLDEMTIDLQTLGTCMEDGVFGNIFNDFIVIVKRNGQGRFDVKISKKISYPF